MSRQSMAGNVHLVSPAPHPSGPASRVSWDSGVCHGKRGLSTAAVTESFGGRTLILPSTGNHGSLYKLDGGQGQHHQIRKRIQERGPRRNSQGQWSPPPSILVPRALHSQAWLKAGPSLSRVSAGQWEG